MQIRALILAAILALLPQGAAAATYSLRFFQVDDDLSAYITNSGFSHQLVLHRGFGPDYPYVDITPFVRNGSNTLDLELVNGPMGWTYGYDFRINDVTFASDACGIFNTHGCNNDAYGQGIVWTKSIQFNVGGDQGGPSSEVPEPATWLQLLAGFSLLGMAVRRRQFSMRACPV